MKTIAPHVTSVVAALGAFTALIHPGFSVGSGVQATVVSVCAVVAGVIQFFHAAQHQSAKANLASMMAYAEHFSKEVTPTPPTA